MAATLLKKPSNISKKPSTHTIKRKLVNGAPSKNLLSFIPTGPPWLSQTHTFWNWSMEPGTWRLEERLLRINDPPPPTTWGLRTTEDKFNSQAKRTIKSWSYLQPDTTGEDRALSASRLPTHHPDEMGTYLQRFLVKTPMTSLFTTIIKCTRLMLRKPKCNKFSRFRSHSKLGTTRRRNSWSKSLKPLCWQEVLEALSA